MNQVMRQLLAELELTSNGCGYKWNSSGHGKSESRPPVSGDDDPPHLRYRRDYERASTDQARDRVVDQARDELRRIRGQYERPQGVGETDKQWKARLVKEGQGFEPGLVALRFNTTAKLVKSVRLELGCFPQSGRLMGPVTNRDERIRVLIDEGASVAQVAGLLKMNGPTVWRIAKRGG